MKIGEKKRVEGVLRELLEKKLMKILKALENLKSFECKLAKLLVKALEESVQICEKKLSESSEKSSKLLKALSRELSVKAFQVLNESWNGKFRKKAVKIKASIS